MSRVWACGGGHGVEAGGRARARRAGLSLPIPFFSNGRIFLPTPRFPLPLPLAPSHSTAHPTWGIGEIGKELGAMWKKVTEAEKVKYNAAAEKDKARYQKELAAYNKSS